MTRIYFYFYFFILLDRDKQRLSTTSSLLICTQLSGLGQVEARNPEFNPGLPHECQGRKHSSYLLPLRLCSRTKQDRKQRSRD